MFKKIKGYNYFISNTGEVKNIKGLIMKPQIDDEKYVRISLSKNGIKKRFGVHRLVAIHFIENLKEKPEVNHKDGNKLNNNAENLEWVTRSENLKHAYKIGLMKNAKGEKATTSKLKRKDVLIILKRDQKQKDLANRFNVSQSLISQIQNGVKWNHLKDVV